MTSKGDEVTGDEMMDDDPFVAEHCAKPCRLIELRLKFYFVELNACVCDV